MKIAFSFPVAINGLIRFVGSLDDCKRRAQILVPPGDRDRQDLMLQRVLRSQSA